MQHEPPINVGTLLQVAQFISAAVVIPGTFALVRVLWNIKEHLSKLNGHVQENTQRWADHDLRVAAEDRHHEEMHDKCAMLHAERLNNVQAQLQQLWGRIGDRRAMHKPTD